MRKNQKVRKAIRKYNEMVAYRQKKFEKELFKYEKEIN